ncbi:unnamed protein product [Nezara viridula]|uniref:Uncharacterized protein n=1 Tax=Nezara viridula TaxID=85310 RepID=A0A9P0E959_NEZVI|nr:unnamed protein product [Nezara viridula]
MQPTRAVPTLHWYHRPPDKHTERSCQPASLGIQLAQRYFQPKLSCQSAHYWQSIGALMVYHNCSHSADLPRYKLAN